MIKIGLRFVTEGRRKFLYRFTGIMLITLKRNELCIEHSLCKPALEAPIIMP